MSAMQIGAYGAMAASARFDRAASKTVEDTARGNDIVSDFANQIEARASFDASISVIKTANAMTGRLLNIKA